MNETVKTGLKIGAVIFILWLVGFVVIFGALSWIS